MRFGVVVFPGTWSDTDCFHVLKEVFNQPVEYVWHKETDLSSYDCVVLPGGFSYGDYLRCGAIARFSPVMGAVEEFAASGKLVLGICKRLSGALRGRAAPRRADTQRLSPVPMPVGPPARRDRLLALHTSRHSRPDPCGCRSPTARAATSPTRIR